MPAALLPIYLPAGSLGKKSKGQPKYLGPVTLAGDLDEAPGSLVAIWVVNQQMEDLCHSFKQLNTETDK